MLNLNEEHNQYYLNPNVFVRDAIKLVHGDPNIQLDKNQEAVLELFDKFKYVIVDAPRQSGKSTLGLFYLFHHALFNGDVNLAFVSRNSSQSKADYIYLFSVLKECGYVTHIKECGYVTHIKEKCGKYYMTFTNGSRLSMIGSFLSDVVSERFDIILLNDYAQFPDYECPCDYDCSLKNKDSKFFILSTDEEDQKDNQFRQFFKAAKEGKNKFVPYKFN